MWSYGYKEAYNRFIDWFEQAFNVCVQETRISRVDICVDTDEIEFVESDIKSVVTKTRKKRVVAVKTNSRGYKYISPES